MPPTCRSLRSSERRTAKIYPNGYWSRGPLFLVQHRLPDVFQTDSQLAEDWRRPERYYLVADHLQMARFEKLMGAENANVVISSGGKIALTNHPFAGTQLPAGRESRWKPWRGGVPARRIGAERVPHQ